MPTTAELDARLQAVEAKILAAVTPPKGCVHIDETKVSDKTGWTVYGSGKANINSSLGFAGVSAVANPTEDADFSYFTFLAFE